MVRIYHLGDQKTQHLISSACTNLGYTYLGVDSIQGLEELLSEPWDLYLIDNRVPDGGPVVENGENATKKILATHAEANIVVYDRAAVPIELAMKYIVKVHQIKWGDPGFGVAFAETFLRGFIKHSDS